MYRKSVLFLGLSVLCLATIASGASLKATNPDPANGAVGVSTPLLRWTRGDTAMFHNVYLGTTPELTDADPPGHVFAGASKERQLEVVDHPRPVGRQVRDHPTLDQVH